MQKNRQFVVRPRGFSCSLGTLHCVSVWRQCTHQSTTSWFLETSNFEIHRYVVGRALIL